MIIRIAELNVDISCCSDGFQSLCEDFLYDGEPDIFVKITAEDIKKEEKFFSDELKYEGLDLYQPSEFQLESTAIYRKIADALVDFDAFVFHASAVAYNDFGYLFTAKSGTGKTTHTELWLKNFSDCFVINGDKPIIRKIGGEYYVFGTPWKGREGLGTNSKAKIKAIVALNRAESNSIVPAEFSEIFPLLIQQTYRPSAPEKLIKSLNLIKNFNGNISFFNLFCNMEDEAALKTFEVITK